ncbi:hypothetical protein [Heyndrickxia coagulans]|nr:hypothetical protein [Heyndrickxia coagulans]
MKKITKIEGNMNNSFIKPKTRVVAYFRVSTDSDEVRKLIDLGVHI